jgi:hypothetical protein
LDERRRGRRRGVAHEGGADTEAGEDFYSTARAVKERRAGRRETGPDFREERDSIGDTNTCAKIDI